VATHICCLDSISNCPRAIETTISPRHGYDS
jgi:hypothetical protein